MLIWKVNVPFSSHPFQDAPIFQAGLGHLAAAIISYALLISSLHFLLTSQSQFILSTDDTTFATLISSSIIFLGVLWFFRQIFDLIVEGLLLPAGGRVDHPAQKQEEEHQMEEDEEVYDRQGSLVSDTEIKYVVEESPPHFWMNLLIRLK